MIKISLDEYGQFEEYVDSTPMPTYIAGLLFDDNDVADECERERKRIEAFYSTVIAEAGATAQYYTNEFKYPQALHADSAKPKNYNHFVVKPVKTLVSDNLSEFLRAGTYKGRPLLQRNGRPFPAREGSYKLFTCLKSTNGKRKLMSDSANFLAKDDYASNLYFHMADEVIKRLIFQNPYKSKINTYSLDLATRSSINIDDIPEEERKEYRKQGYKEQTSRDGSRIYYAIADASMYRIILANHLIESDKVGTKINDLHVRSIYYRDRTDNMEFLYLADSICSILGHDIPGNSEDEWLCKIRERMTLLNGNDPENNYLFGYDDMDVVLDKVMEAYKIPDFYQVYSLLYDAMREEGEFAKLYKETWFHKIIEKTILSKNTTAFRQGIHYLNSAIRSNKVDQAKLLFIYKHLEAKVEAILDTFATAESKNVIYQLYSAGISTYSYIGDSIHAMECYEKCKQYAGCADLEELLRAKRKYCVLLNDSFCYEEAVQTAQDIIVCQEEISETLHLLMDTTENTHFFDDAKALSLLGQSQSFLRKPEAEVTFKQALRLLPADSANYRITLSYLLHFYLDTGQREKYLSESIPYFGDKKSVAQQLTYIISEGVKERPTIALEYALYVWIKGVYLFRSGELLPATWEKLLDIRNHIASKRIQSMGHAINDYPWMLIYVYIHLLAINRKESEEAFEIIKRESDAAFTVKSVFLEALVLYGNIRIAHLEGDLVKRNELMKQLVSVLNDNFIIFKKKPLSDDLEEIYLQLQSLFTYMYN